MHLSNNFVTFAALLEFYVLSDKVFIKHIAHMAP